MHERVKTNARRELPSVEKVLRLFGETSLPRQTLLAVVRRELAELRHSGSIPDQEAIVERIGCAVSGLLSQKIQPVINGTGVIIHTNLGRAPLGPKVVETLTQIAGRYTNLEYDLSAGARGGRAKYLEESLALLCSAQAATVVNNCAAALVLILRHFTKQKPEVIISRGELIQIGGGFRIPDILEASGARLREIGTTNKTGLNDYARAIGPRTALILKVHRSNFFMDGFVASPSTEEIAALAKKKKIPFVEDLGSGAIVSTEKVRGVEHEPTPSETLRRGADLVCFSGDKLFGGAQAGIVAGRARLVAALKREPFFRALRCDKLVLGALQATVDLYLRGQTEELPVLQMLRISVSALRERAEEIRSRLSDLPVAVEIGEGKAQIGGGSLPRSSIPSITLDFAPRDPEAFARKLRNASPPIVGFKSGKKFRLDLRTIFPSQDRALLTALRAANS
jgi:L-seryl-tRNA(Ser) seleniumtransferase